MQQLIALRESWQMKCVKKTSTCGFLGLIFFWFFFFDSHKVTDLLPFLLDSYSVNLKHPLSIAKMSHLRCVISNSFGKVYRTCNVWVFCGVKTIINVKIVKSRRNFGHAPIEFLILAMSQLWKIISKRIKKNIVQNSIGISVNEMW